MNPGIRSAKRPTRQDRPGRCVAPEKQGQPHRRRRACGGGGVLSFRARIPADRNVNQRLRRRLPRSGDELPTLPHPAGSDISPLRSSDRYQANNGRQVPPSRRLAHALGGDPNTESPGTVTLQSGNLLMTISTRRRCSGYDAFPGYAERKSSHTLASRLGRVDPAGAALEQDLPGNRHREPNFPVGPHVSVGPMRQRWSGGDAAVSRRDLTTAPGKGPTPPLGRKPAPPIPMGPSNRRPHGSTSSQLRHRLFTSGH